MVRLFSVPKEYLLHEWFYAHALALMLVADGLFGFAVPDSTGPQSLDSSQRPEDVFASPNQLAGEPATLTLLPRSRWQMLLKLEVIQQRNKPKEPPKPLENNGGRERFLAEASRRIYVRPL
ncbi:hypothetical protein BDM02DRAFT_3114474 [Thelephora ganbajun]|uniref:Uncharacterized protein n=1 Tax=Thelephora ganbajun TaxID=370292 RepID=A0ACB6ZIK3_THEGA|nr:hypothetical protein BDM02DRAFT_3114474 [Thelephora ganbajun]